MFNDWIIYYINWSRKRKEGGSREEGTEEVEVVCELTHRRFSEALGIFNKAVEIFYEADPNTEWNSKVQIDVLASVRLLLQNTERKKERWKPPKGHWIFTLKWQKKVSHLNSSNWPLATISWALLCVWNCPPPLLYLPPLIMPTSQSDPGDPPPPPANPSPMLHHLIFI